MKLSPTMKAALELAGELPTGGFLHRLPGGFWHGRTWCVYSKEWVGTTTVEALGERRWQVNPTLEEMNALQSLGIISDLCVSWADVADADKERALVWLEVGGRRDEGFDRL